MKAPIYKLEPNREPLLEFPPEVIEKACAAYWQHLSWPNVLTWADLVEEGDHRVPRFRGKMQAALTALVQSGMMTLWGWGDWVWVRDQP